MLNRVIYQMRVDLGKVEVARDKEDRGAGGRESARGAGHALCGLDGAPVKISRNPLAGPVWARAQMPPRWERMGWGTVFMALT